MPEAVVQELLSRQGNKTSSINALLHYPRSALIIYTTEQPATPCNATTNDVRNATRPS